MTRRRKPPHVKISVNIANHPKTAGFANDPLLLGIYCNIGIMAVDRWASKTDDSFLCSGLDLQRLAGCQGVANAKRRLGQLEARGGPRLSHVEATAGPAGGQAGAMWRLTIDNFTERQGFKKLDGTEKPPPPTPTPTTTTTPTPIDIPDPPDGGPIPGSEDPGEGATKGTIPSKAKAKAGRCARVPTTDQKRRLEEWGARRPEKFTPEQMAHAWEVVWNWDQEATRKPKKDWARAVINAMTSQDGKEPWGLRGFVGPKRLSPRTQAFDDALRARIESEKEKI